MKTLIETADACLTRGEYRRAESLYREALHLAEEMCGKHDPQMALILNALGVLYKYMGRFAEAGRAYRRALRIIEGASNGLEDKRAIQCALATLYHNLGGLEHARGRFAKGEPHARRSVVLRIAALGEDDPAVAADRAALAALLDGQGKYDEAEALYERALEVFERVYGPGHYEIAVTLNNLAAMHQARDNPAVAEQLYRRAVAIKEKLLGRRHPDVAMTVHNLAVLIAEQGRCAEAERLYQRALAIFRKSLDPGHPKLAVVERNLNRFLRSKSRGQPCRK